MIAVGRPRHHIARSGGRAGEIQKQSAQLRAAKAAKPSAQCREERQADHFDQARAQRQIAQPHASAKLSSVAAVK